MDTLFDLDAPPERPPARERPRAAEPPPAAVPPPAETPPRPRRRSSKGIGPGDIVEVDRRGRRFHALVTGIHRRDTGHHDLDLRPLDPRTTYYTATVREVVAVWRRAGGA